ncbi:carbohydrate ABC transporter permease [Catenulispora rubra]|uniref:carbohydrate ABC transporter permease n=1 Tax=Catenulispora rubra TaxID=280293 RepID=UPI0018921FDE|nr:sugar ABC transporter permease [Catenulispora rubra]
MSRRVTAVPGRGTAARQSGGAATVLLTPFFLVFLAAMVAPIGYAVYLSLWTQRLSGLGFGGARQVFDGFGNYSQALHDPAFRHGFLTVAGYCVLYVPVMLTFALVLALLLDSALVRARRLFQLALFLPHAVPGLIAALVWTYLYTPGISPVIRALNSTGVHIDLLSSGAVLPSVVNVAVWEWTGYNVVVFYAALQAIPREVIEAATVDGSTGPRTARSVKIPMIRPALVLAALFTVIGALQLFTEPMILRGNSAAITSTWTPNMYAYSAAFDQGNYGLAAAASVLLAVVAAMLSFAVTRITARRPAPSRRTEDAAA